MTKSTTQTLTNSHIRSPAVNDDSAGISVSTTILSINKRLGKKSNEETVIYSGKHLLKINYIMTVFTIPSE